MDKIPKIIREDFKVRNSSAGIIDIAAGLYFIVIGFAFMFDVIFMASVLLPIIFAAVIFMRKALITPRLGYVEHKGIKNNMRNTMTITLIIGIVCFIAAFFVYLRTGTGSRSDDVRQFVQNYGALILGAVIALVVTLLAKSFEISRYYIYAILIFCAFCAMNFIQYENIISVSFFSLGVVILVAGIVLLSLFLKKYPRLDKENEQ
jgi:hypothetical protein